MRDDPASWALLLRRRADDRLSRTAGRPLGPAATRGFAAWRAGNASHPARPPADDTPTPAQSIDDALWRALCDESSPIDHLFAGGSDANPAPISGPRTGVGIEVWTETELSAMQALWWLARRRGRPDWGRRLARGVAWMLEHIQPDNATNRPWAICVFLEHAQRTGDADALLYAETLLHNADLGADLDDPLVAHILADNANAMESLASDL